MKKRRVFAAALTLAMVMGLPAHAVGTDRNYHAMAGGSGHSLAVTEDGDVYTWGTNNSMQLGLEDLTGAKKPQKVEGFKAVAVAAGYDFSAALSYDGSVYVWGAGKHSTPRDLYLTNIVEIDAGQTDILALRADGTVWQWVYGGSLNQVQGLSRVVDISAGGGHNLALTLDGQVYAWGSNYMGQLGDGTTQDRSTPVKLPLLNVVDISAGFSHSLAATFDGKVYAWGSNDYGQLGNGTTENSNVPVEVKKITSAARVAAGNNNSLCLDQKGNVSAWGYGEYGQMGNGGGTATNSTPVSVSSLGGKVAAIECGMYHCFAVTNGGALYTWGRNKDGQLGNNKDVNSNSPQKVRDNITVGGAFQPDATQGASGWAVPEIRELYAQDLVPPMLWGNYTENITRAEFAGLLVGLYENVKGYSATESTSKKYTDLKDHPLEHEVRKALNLGVLNGSSETTVSPDRSLTRQEGAKMLCSFIGKMNGTTISQKLESLAFYTDARQISDWAAPYIYYAYQNDIMKGSSTGEFAPLNNLTREQSLITVNRLVEKYGWGGNEPLRWQYRLGLSCQMGPRRNNEDNFYFNGLYKTLELADKPMELSAVAEGSAVAAVCDGMGGEAFGEYAAWSAAVALAEWARALDGEDQVRTCVREMNRRICAEGARRQCRMGCTLALAVLRDGTAQVYNVGDSRIYLCSKGKLRQLSADHTAAQELLNMGMAVPKGSRKYDQLTQYLGLPEEELLLEAHRAEADLETGDRLLLCSDGLTDAVPEEEIALVLSDGAPPDVQALRLTRRAERAGGKDNVTALVIEASR